ncbi:amino acid adenylation domain-containing protein [Sphingobacterium kitahiroshimense]|uniref:Amino acid adenylation domain-containing protein n=1 Tax=Sphingobacterium kitahiroshimense TaxID=470446 RepID=A0ABV0BN33_9SPHI
MTILEIITELKKYKVVPRIENSNLKLIGETKNLSQALIETIKEYKEELMAFIVASNDHLAFAPISPIARHDYYPTTNAQKRLWILSQFEGGNTAYNIIKSFFLTGDVDYLNLNRAFKNVVVRHESLRTVFKEVEGELVQIVLDECDFTLDFEDISCVEDKVSFLNTQVQESNDWLFDLEEGPLLKVKLFKISALEYAMIFAIHHIISDGWSIGVMVKEIMGLYKALQLNEIYRPEPLRIHYKDYTKWMSDRLLGEKSEKAQKFWSTEFAEVVEPLELLFGNVRTEIKKYGGEVSKFYFSNDLQDRILEFCKKSQATSFNFFRATLNILLYKFSGQKTIVIGSPVSGRNHFDLEDQIGLYVNTLPLKLCIEPTDSFNELLDKVSQHSLKAFEFQDYPLDQIIQDLNIKRDISRNPLFDVMMVLQNTEMGDGTINLSQQFGFELNLLDKYLDDNFNGENEARSTKFDLSFNFNIDPDGKFFLEIEYSTNLFDREQIRSLRNAYISIFNQVLDCPQKTINAIEIIGDEEKDQILYEFNKAKVKNVENLTLSELFEQKVSIDPNSIAIFSQFDSFTYTDINEASNRLADYFRKNYNIQPDDLIGLKLRRNEWMIIAILAVLKSGGAYIPIDPDLPQNRIEAILSDSNCKVLVDDIELLKFRQQQLNYNEDNVVSGASVKNLAYVIYTSGSTGKPKGVMIEHRSVISFLKNFEERFSLTENLILGAITNYAFDISVLELLGTLIKGIKIVLIADSDPISILDLIDNQNITALQITPSKLKQIISAPENCKGNLEKLDVLLVGGEALGQSTYEYLKSTSIRKIINVYGPTETTIWSSAMEVSASEELSIGEALINERIYITSENNQQLMPIGTIGEICISGEGLARGYLNQPEISARKFIKNPFEPGEKLYKTGDLGKWLANGNIQFISRLDDQVKIRGFRVETGDIEHAICLIESVKSAVVTVSVNSYGENDLVAYYVSGTAISEVDLKSHLDTILPYYMIPSYFIHLETLPLTANGKLDKKKLPSLKDVENLLPTKNESPKSVTEKKLVEIWQIVLDKEKIGIQDNFFDIGGHSLKATVLRSLISKTFGKTLSLNDIFIHPTILKQASFIESKISSLTKSFLIEPAEIRPYYPISFSQERLWVLTNFEEASKSYNMPAAFRISGTMNLDLLESAFKIMISKYEILRTVFAEKDGVPVQIIVDPEKFDFAIERFCVNDDSDAEILKTLELELERPFDLENGPLFRCFVIKTDVDDVLAFSIHHIISDGWSVSVFYETVMNIYEDLVSGNGYNEVSLAFQYKDFSVWQRKQISEGLLMDSQTYWKEEVFSDGCPVLELATDYSRPTVKTYNGQNSSNLFDSILSTKIHKLAKEENVSTFMILLAGVNVLLKKHANQNDIVIGTPVAGREYMEFFDQIGFYVNTLPIRTTMDGNMSFSALLQMTKKHVLEAFDHQNFPFEMLVNELDLMRDLSRSPLFDVMVVYQNDSIPNQQITSWSGKDLRLKRINITQKSSKYDLTFFFVESSDGILLELEFNSDLFKVETIERFIVHLYRIFDQVTAQPDKRIMDINPLPLEEQELIASNMDRSNVKFDTASTLVSLFGNILEKYPDRTAIQYNGKKISYAQLDEKSDQIAALLVHEFKVGTDELVLLHFERSEWMIYSILGVLKAGAAYVPVDPTYPENRIKYIVEDCGSRIIISDSELPESFKSLWPEKVFFNVANFESSQKKVSISIQPQNLAYVIYTSGTTGNPKGVLVEHGQVTRLLFNEENLFDFNEHDVWPLFHSYCFDVSVWEMYGALLNGGTLIVVPKETCQNSIDFLDFIVEQKITVLNQTPTAFKSLINNNIKRLGGMLESSHIRYLIFAGEKLNPEILLDWHTTIPTCKIVNMYGITETTVHVTYKLITSTEIRQKKSNIGIPLPTLSCYILDVDLQQVPIGVAGELFVGGAGVSRGYLNRTALTLEKFKDNPFAYSGKIYRSGDYAKILPSGEMEYIGRKDDQVKIRGYRIEFAEVESGMLKIPEIKDAIALSIKNNMSEDELVGYFIGDKKLSEEELRKQLINHLPNYMVPTYLIEMIEFPLNRNGKVDKTALPGPEIVERTRLPIVPGRNQIDMDLIDIWKGILAKEEIGIQDNFFDLGGHSLKATRVISKIYEKYGVKMDLKNLFIDPTIEHLSNYIETVRWMADENEVTEDSDEMIF